MCPETLEELSQLREQCHSLQQVIGDREQELNTAKKELHKIQQTLILERDLYQKLQEDFENAIYHLKGSHHYG